MNYDISVYKKSDFFVKEVVPNCTFVKDHITVNTSEYEVAQEIIRNLTKKYPNESFWHHVHGIPYGDMWFVYEGGMVVYVSKKEPIKCTKCGFVWYDPLIKDKCKICRINDKFKK